MRANQNRAQSPALLRGLIFGIDGRALSPTHTVRRGRQYRYYVSQSVLKGGAPSDPSIVRRIAAAEIEAVVMAQVRALIRQPEVIVGTWQAARSDAPDLTEDQVRAALERFEPMWDELFPGEQARIVQALVERVTVSPTGADIRLRVEGPGRVGPRPTAGGRVEGRGMSGATSITVRVPMAIRKRGGRKVIVSPDGSVLPGAPRQATTTAVPALLKALARAFRWRQLLEEGRYDSISEIARAEKLDRTYVGDILRLTLLAPAVVEAIMEGRQPTEMTLPILMKPFSAEWEGQRDGVTRSP